MQTRWEKYPAIAYSVQASHYPLDKLVKSAKIDIKIYTKARIALQPLTRKPMAKRAL